MGSYAQEQGDMGKRAGGFVAGLVMGGLVGAGTMLLLAPQSGKKTRAKLQHEGIEMRDQVAETVQGAVAQARSVAHRVVDRAQEQTKDLKQRGQELLDDQREVIANAVEAGKETVHDITSS